MSYFKKVVAKPQIFNTGAAFDFSGFGSGDLWIALITFLYVDFLDTTGTLFSMCNFVNIFIPGLLCSLSAVLHVLLDEKTRNFVMLLSCWLLVSTQICSSSTALACLVVVLLAVHQLPHLVTVKFQMHPTGWCLLPVSNCGKDCGLQCCITISASCNVKSGPRQVTCLNSSCVSTSMQTFILYIGLHRSQRTRTGLNVACLLYRTPRHQVSAMRCCACCAALCFAVLCFCCAFGVSAQMIGQMVLIGWFSNPSAIDAWVNE